MRLPAGEVARAALVLLAIGLGTWVLRLLRELVLLVLLGVLLATAVEEAEAA